MLLAVRINTIGSIHTSGTSITTDTTLSITMLSTRSTTTVSTTIRAILITSTTSTWVRMVFHHQLHRHHYDRRTDVRFTSII